MTESNQATINEVAGNSMPLDGDSSSLLSEVDLARKPRVVLLTPYTGGNFGDAAIQDALIASFRLRLPNAQFAGISLHCGNFLERHGIQAFPLCASNTPFYGMYGDKAGSLPLAGGFSGQTVTVNALKSSVKAILKRIPGLRWAGRKLRAWMNAFKREYRHCVEGYRFLRSQDLLIVSGGGQLDEEWGGAWGHPYALFKWAALARKARIPFVIASVGACKVDSRTSRLFLSAALRMAHYRSYRDKNSRQIAATLFHRAASDAVVPDLAFGLPASEIPSRAEIRSYAKGRTVIAISPICYGRPENWPNGDRAIYARYVAEMPALVSQLLRRDYFLVFVRSARDDELVIPELLDRLGPESKARILQQVCVPALTDWKDLVSVLLDVDALVASRLHSTIFGFLAHTPTVAISFDPKVDWVMQELKQANYLLQIRHFVASDVVAALDRMQSRRKDIVQELASYQEQIHPMLARQFDDLASVATLGPRPEK